MAAKKKTKTAKRRPAPKRRPAQRARAGEAPRSDEEVGVLVGRAAELLMRHGVKACLRAKLPSSAIFMAATEQVGILASMIGLPYPQALQSACNGVESAYRTTAPEQVKADRPIDEMARAMIQKAVSTGENPQNLMRTQEETHSRLDKP